MTKFKNFARSLLQNTVLGLSTWSLLFSAIPASAQSDIESTPTSVEDNASVASPMSYKLDYDRADALLKKMSLEQKVGQLLIVGFVGHSVNESLRKHLSFVRPGGVIIFQRNIRSTEQITRLNDALTTQLTKVSQVLPLLMVDQEGGQVNRLRWRPANPSALALGMANKLEWTERSGALTGELLRRLKFNMNLAPVVDLSNPNELNFVGNRSFGDNPQRVQAQGLAYMKGRLSHGVLGTIKHFPGHGEIQGDSHKFLPEKLLSLKDLEAGALLPFQIISETGLPTAMMIAHLALPLIDQERRPATYSPVIHDLLQKKMGFSGLVITDDLEMAGAATVDKIGERAVTAIEAGNDMIMFAYNLQSQKEAFNALLEAARTGRLAMERIDKSVRKILAHKLLLDKIKTQLPTDRRTLAQVIRETVNYTHELIQFHMNQHIESNPAFLTSIRARKKFFIFSGDPHFTAETKKIMQINPGQVVRGVPITLGSKERIESLLARNPSYTGIFYMTGQVSARLLDSLSEDTKKQILVINTLYPGAMRPSENYIGVVNVYSRDEKVGYWLLERAGQRNNGLDTPDEKISATYRSDPED